MWQDTSGRSRDLFPTDEPVPGRMIGRQAEVSQLKVALAEGLHQLVAGPRRQGKTTVCQAALSQLRNEPGYYTVAVDLFQMANLAQLSRAIVSALVSNRSSVRRGVGAARQAARKLAEATAELTTAKLKAAWGADVEIGFARALSEHDPRGAFEKALRLLQAAADADNRQVVLFIDEFQEVAGPRQIFGDPDDLTKLMRHVLHASPRVTCLFAGSRFHLVRDLFGDERRAFYKFGHWHELHPITDAEWSAGLAERFKEGGRPIDRLAVRALLDQSEGHVRTTMLLAQQAFYAAVLANSDHVSVEHAVAALDMALSADAEALVRDVERIRDSGRYALSVCQAIALGEPPYKRGRPARVSDAIESLEGLGVVERRGNPGRGGWVVIDPLLRRYLVLRSL